MLVMELKQLQINFILSSENDYAANHLTSNWTLTYVSDCDPVILNEDLMLEGFVPLLHLSAEPKFVHTTVDKVSGCEVDKARYVCMLLWNMKTH